MKTISLVLISLVIGLGVVRSQEKKQKPAPAPVVKIDPQSGLKMGKDWELVNGHCSACHSPKHFLRQKGNRQTWKEIIEWMQETQGLWDFDPDTEKRILDYLATYYAPEEAYRRAPIAPQLMPLNPYKNSEGIIMDKKSKSAITNQ